MSALVRSLGLLAKFFGSNMTSPDLYKRFLEAYQACWDKPYPANWKANCAYIKKLSDMYGKDAVLEYLLAHAETGEPLEFIKSTILAFNKTERKKIEVPKNEETWERIKNARTHSK